MTRWLIKREIYTFDFSDPVAAANRLHNAIAAEGQAGWEPWNIDGWARNMTEYVTVFYKRPDES